MLGCAPRNQFQFLWKLADCVCPVTASFFFPGQLVPEYHRVTDSLHWSQPQSMKQVFYY